MKKIISKGKVKSFLALFLCAVMTFSMSGCSILDFTYLFANFSPSQGTEEEFKQFVEDFAFETAQSSYMTTHIMMENPEDFGIDKSECPLEISPHFDENSWDETASSIEELQTELKRYNPDNLSAEMRNIYYYLEFYADSSSRLNQDKFKYYGCAFEQVSGIHAQLPSILGEWDFRCEQDIKDIIEIMKDIPSYIDSLLVYTSTQVERGEWVGDVQGIINSCQEVIDNGENSSMLKGMLNNIQKVELTDKQLEEYTAEITQTYKDYIIPAYQSIIDAMNSIDERSQVQGSIADLEYGKEYYEALFYSNTSVDKEIEQVVDEIDDMRNQIMYELQSVLYSNPQLLDTMGEDITTGFTSYEEIIGFLSEKYEEDFPAIDFPKYEAEPLAKDMEVDGISAYFVIPPLDHSSPMKIRVNTGTGNDISSVNTFTTLAHEGVPGHMYQTAYVYENFSPWTNIICDFIGYTEGYATYVELYSLQYLSGIEGISQDDLNFLRLYNMYDYLTVAYLDIQVNYYGMSLEDMAVELGYSRNDTEAIEPLYEQLIYNPGVFLPYYIGFLEIYQLRTDAEQSLGTSFSDKDFHQVLLQSGSVSFNAVERNVRDYISSYKKMSA